MYCIVILRVIYAKFVVPTWPNVGTFFEGKSIKIVVIYFPADVEVAPLACSLACLQCDQIWRNFKVLGKRIFNFYLVIGKILILRQQMCEAGIAPIFFAVPKWPKLSKPSGHLVTLLVCSARHISQDNLNSDGHTFSICNFATNPPRTLLLSVSPLDQYYKTFSLAPSQLF